MTYQGANMTGGAGPTAGRVLGRYALFDEIAAGGMATVHLGRMLGPVGFSKTVAIKRLHPHLSRDPEFVSMFLDEARLAARIQHPNVVATLDVVSADGEVFLVLDYVQGESLSHLLKATRIKGTRVSPRVVASILVNALHGLHSAHEAQDEHGRQLGIVHRDVSPQNILVGIDGVARVLDFGVAKAAGRLQSTRDGQLKGKLAYMAPEQIRGEEVDRRTDIYAAAVVLWEGLVGRRLAHGANEGQVLATVLGGNFTPPSVAQLGVTSAADAIVMRGLAAHPTKRYATAREMAIALEHALGVASPYEVAEWVQSVGAETLAIRAARVREMESTSAVRVSLHDDAPPEIWHGNQPVYDASRSGITSPSQVSQVPRPPAPVSYPEVTGSVVADPNLVVAAPPPYPHQPFLPSPSAQPVRPPLVGPHLTPTAPAARYAQSMPYPHPQPTHPPPPNRLKLILASVAASMAVGLVLITILLVVRTRPRAQPEAVQPPAATAPAATATTTAAPTAEVPATPTATVAPVESTPVVDVPPVAVSDPAPEAKATAKPVAKPEKPATPATTKPKAETKPKSKNCDVPFFVDQNGIKQIKPECM
jgi:serine/threonine-protein kinase